MDVIIRSRRLWWSGGDWLELWRYRELFWTLAWRTILVHYKQTVVGVAWALIRPLLTMLIFTVIFGKLAKLPAGNVPYPLLVFAAVLPWQFFANSLTESSNSVVAHAGMINKIYFPRMIIPAAAVISGLIDFGLAFIAFIGLMAWYGVVPGSQIVFLPFFLLLAFCTAFGAGLWLSALNVRFHDVRIIVPFLVQLGLYISPVGFSSTVVPARWHWLYALNPMVGVIDGFRWCLLGQGAPTLGTGFWLSVMIAILMLAGGIVFFSRMERTFADVI